jgi:hypothetical protein
MEEPIPASEFQEGFMDGLYFGVQQPSRNFMYGMGYKHGQETLAGRFKGRTPDEETAKLEAMMYWVLNFADFGDVPEYDASEEEVDRWIESLKDRKGKVVKR